jgi:hypothetical protein
MAARAILQQPYVDPIMMPRQLPNWAQTNIQHINVKVVIELEFKEEKLL